MLQLSVQIRSQTEIDNLRTKYGDVWTDGHGGIGGNQHNVKIEADEKIIIVQVLSIIVDGEVVIVNNRVEVGKGSMPLSL